MPGFIISFEAIYLLVRIEFEIENVILLLKYVEVWRQFLTTLKIFAVCSTEIAAQFIVLQKMELYCSTSW